MTERPVLGLGGAGFVGRHVVERLVADGHEVVVPTRRRDRARRLLVLPTVNVAAADVSVPAHLLPLVQDASAVINLVGILNETNGQTFQRTHVELVRNVIDACREAGVPRLVQMSALNADPAGPSRYLRSKGEGEAAVIASGLEWTIVQPSVIFGPEDAFLNLFARILRFAPVMALARAEARFQPVYVRDVAECIVGALGLPATTGRTFPLCGPKIYTLRELVRYVGDVTGRPRPIIALGPWLGRLEGDGPRAPAGNHDEPRQPSVDAGGQHLRMRLSARIQHPAAGAGIRCAVVSRSRVGEGPVRRLSPARRPLNPVAARAVARDCAGR